MDENRPSALRPTWLGGRRHLRGGGDRTLRLRAPSDVLLLYAARAVRGFGDGFAVIILPAYLAAIGYDPIAIGIVATASLLGTAVMTLGVGAIAPRYDLRTLMLAGGYLTALTGLAFPNVEHIVLVALVAFVGTINPATGDLGVLVPLEHAMLAREVPDRERTRTFARYSLVGALSMAAGSLAASLPDFSIFAGIGKLGAFKLMFYAYAVLGLASATLYRRLPRAQVREAAPSAPLGPSRSRVYKLSALFSLDSFAGGFIVQSLLALWLFERFDLSLSAAAVFFFWASTLTAFSYPLAARLSRHIGLVNTMVYTHIPSSVLLIIAAFSPSLYLTLGLLLVRAALSQMDVPTRTSYIMAVVTPPERAAAASVTAVPRSLAAAISPAFAGVLLSSAFPGLPLVVCGVLKIVYDLGLLFSFRHIKPPEEQG
jgi:MFS family permease